MNLEQLKEANELVESFKSAIIGNIIITLRDSETHELLFSCATDTNYNWLAQLGKDIDVEQDINVYAVLQALSELEEAQHD